MRAKTVAVAESCTGGLLGALLTKTPGASDYFLGGVLAYHNRVKQTLLGIPKRLLLKHGAVSRETAERMAGNIRKKLRADVGVSITGIAGPSGGTREKPAGLVYIALADGKGTRCRKFVFSGGRERVRAQAARKAFNWVKREAF